MPRWIAVVALGLLATPVAARDKTDVIVLDNGDRITGEIKSLDRGLMAVSTTAMGTVSVEWIHVASVDSDFEYQVELADGRVLLGSLNTADASARLQIGGDAANEIDRDGVVRIAPIEGQVLARFKGSASVGLNYTKSSQTRQSSFGLDGTYRGERIDSRFSLSSIATEDGETGKKSDRTDLSNTLRFLRPDRWFGAGILQAQRNEDLGIEVRASAGGGYGRYLRQNNKLNIAATGGVILTREWLVGSDPNETEIEGLAELDLNYYVLDSPKVDVASTLRVYPGISSWGRVRSELDLRFTWEVFNDVFLQLQFYGSYDNQPPTDDSVTTDYGFVTSLGYDF